MKRILLFLMACTISTSALQAAPTPSPGPTRDSTKREKTKGHQETLTQSANGWFYVKGEWVHPEGYKFVNGKVLRTTARTGKSIPTPPGKLALENPQKLTQKNDPDPDSAKTEAEKKAAEVRKNLQPRRTSQTGSNL